MTSASELFHTRRSRFDRNSFELRLDSPVDRISHNNNHQTRRNSKNNHPGRREARDRTDSDNCDPLRRNSNIARALHRIPFPDRESIRVEQGSSQSGSNNNNNNIINPENIRSSRNRQNFNANNSDRLPGSVLLARERLLHRLRGLSSTNRPRNRVSSTSNEDDLTSFGVSNRVLDPEDYDINTRTDMLLASSFQETRKRPCGISEEAFKSLNLETFTNKNETEECSVCLESFVEGEKILSLSCAHSFHSDCLEPWVKICSDCPNCRTCI